MNTLLAVNDGLINNHWNEADISFLVGLILGALAAVAYGAGVGTVTRLEHDDTPGHGVPEVTTTTPTARPWHYRFHELAAALLALAVTAVALGLFLQ